MPRAKADIGRPILAEAFHQVLAPADNADRQAAAERLAVGDEVGADAEIILGAAGREAEADEDLVKDQHDAALAADRAELLEPIGVGRAVEVGPSGAVDQRCIGRRCAVRVHDLHRVDEDAGDVASALQYPQRGLGHVLQCVCLVRRYWIADARLHIAPPAVRGAAKAHQMGAPRMVAREPDRLHDGLRSGHVKRNFIHAGQAQQARGIVGD